MKPGTLLIKGTAGLGNRMLCVLTGIAYATVTGRELVVDWTDPLFSVDRENVFHRFFDCPAVRSLAAFPETQSIRPAVWRGNLHMTAMQMLNTYFPRYLGKYSGFRRGSVDVSRIDYPEELLVMWSWDAQISPFARLLAEKMPDLRGCDHFAMLQKLARRSLVPRPEIATRVDAFIRDHFKRPTVGVHIRYTDRKTPLHKFHEAMARLRGQVGECQFFLATDNQDVEKEFVARYGNVLTMPKGFVAGGSAIHMDLESQERTHRAIEALTEMYLLSRCDRLVYARRSTFSYMAHLLSDLPAEKVIDIDRHNVPFHLKTFAQRVLIGRTPLGWLPV